MKTSRAFHNPQTLSQAIKITIYPISAYHRPQAIIPTYTQSINQPRPQAIGQKTKINHSTVHNYSPKIPSYPYPSYHIQNLPAIAEVYGYFGKFWGAGKILTMDTVDRWYVAWSGMWYMDEWIILIYGYYG